MSVANVALPDIGRHFDSSQTTLDLIAVGYSLGLAATVLYLGALVDRYGRKLMPLLGLALSVPACLLAAFAPSDGTPQHASRITSAAKQSFLDGADWAYAAGIVAVLLGAALVAFRFPRKDEEARLLERYEAEDAGQGGRGPELAAAPA